MSAGTSEYELLRADAAYYPSNECVLTLRGGGVLDFLHRLSTNDVLNLPPHGTVPTILTTEKGRVIDLVQILNTGPDVLMVGPAGHSPTLIQWLARYIIMEDIEIKDVTSEFHRGNVIGPKADSTIGERFKVSPPSLVGTLAITDKTSAQTYIYRNASWQIPSFTILSRAGVSGNAPYDPPYGIPAVSEDTFELVRIEEGIPESGKELTPAVNPLEAGLHGFVSATKGCYIGQEVIARIDTYKKLQKKLTGIILEMDSDERVQPGLLYFPTEQIGFTTSHTYSLRLRKQIGLGYVKVGLRGPLQFAPEGDPRRINAILTDLPFQT